MFFLYADCSGATAYSYTGNCHHNDKLMCKKWNSCEKLHVDEYEKNFATFPSCPCNVDQAKTDSSYDDTTIYSSPDGSIDCISSSSTNVGYGKVKTYQLVNLCIT